MIQRIFFFLQTYNNRMDCMFLGILNPDLIKMVQAFPLHRHICIDLPQLHKDDRIAQIAMLKVDELYKQWCVLPVLNVSITKQPGSMSNYPIRYNGKNYEMTLFYKAKKKFHPNLCFSLTK